MFPTVESFPTLDALRDFVYATLCLAEALEPGQVRFGQALIEKNGRACGVIFRVQGPRSLQPHAVWAADEGRILFYAGTGERRGETRLLNSPDLPSRR